MPANAKIAESKDVIKGRTVACRNTIIEDKKKPLTENLSSRGDKGHSELWKINEAQMSCAEKRKKKKRKKKQNKKKKRGKKCRKRGKVFKIKDDTKEYWDEEIKYETVIHVRK